jgi:sulfite dehydrogenase (cytochrome) subunit B
MTRSNFFALAAVISLSLTPVGASPISYDLPPETAEFKPGPGVEVVKQNCTACHSADYIATQPRGAEFGQDFWRAEVTKMIKAYGAPIADADIDKIVVYLSTTYQGVSP